MLPYCCSWEYKSIHLLLFGYTVQIHLEIFFLLFLFCSFKLHGSGYCTLRLQTSGSLMFTCSEGWQPAVHKTALPDISSPQHIFMSNIGMSSLRRPAGLVPSGSGTVPSLASLCPLQFPHVIPDLLDMLSHLSLKQGMQHSPSASSCKTLPLWAVTQLSNYFRRVDFKCIHTSSYYVLWPQGQVLLIMGMAILL